MAGEGAPCGACRGLRRNCLGNCLFAPYFSSDEIGMDQFSAIHEIFGHNRFVKLLRKLPVDKRNDAVASILYQAQALIDDHVHGCSSYILALQRIAVRKDRLGFDNPWKSLCVALGKACN